jgi:transposase InsO family protein
LCQRSYLPIEGGKFCYLATVIDLASRRLAGWAIADHMRADLVTDALAAADPNPRQSRRIAHAHRPRSPGRIQSVVATPS